MKVNFWWCYSIYNLIYPHYSYRRFFITCSFCFLLLILPNRSFYSVQWCIQLYLYHHFFLLQILHKILAFQIAYFHVGKMVSLCYSPGSCLFPCSQVIWYALHVTIANECYYFSIISLFYIIASSGRIIWQLHKWHEHIFSIKENISYESFGLINNSLPGKGILGEPLWGYWPEGPVHALNIWSCSTKGKSTKATINSYKNKVFPHEKQLNILHPLHHSRWPGKSLMLKLLYIMQCPTWKLMQWGLNIFGLTTSQEDT